MAEKAKKAEFADDPPPDAADMSDLIEDRDGDDITETAAAKVALGKPRGFFRVCPLPEYRKRMGIYVHEVEGKPGRTFYGVTKKMRADIEEAHPCTVVTVVNRLLVPSLWPIKLLDEDGNDYESWKQQRRIAKQAMTAWIRFVKWTGGAYIIRTAPEGYAPEPDWSKLPPYTELLTRALGKKGIIRNHDHPIYKELLGLSQTDDDADDDDDADL
jgi:hypothetical protein